MDIQRKVEALKIIRVGLFVLRCLVIMFMPLLALLIVSETLPYAVTVPVYFAVMVIGVGVIFAEKTNHFAKRLGFDENEAYVHGWISDLKDKGVVKDLEHFNLWINGFENRYSPRTLEIMRAVFK